MYGSGGSFVIVSCFNSLRNSRTNWLVPGGAVNVPFLISSIAGVILFPYPSSSTSGCCRHGVLYVCKYFFLFSIIHSLSIPAFVVIECNTPPCSTSTFITPPPRILLRIDRTLLAANRCCSLSILCLCTFSVDKSFSCAIAFDIFSWNVSLCL